MNSFPSLPNGEQLPLAYRWIRALGLNSIVPWEFIDDEEYRERVRSTFRQTAPQGFDCWPFAYHRQQDRIVAFILGHETADGSVVEFDVIRETFKTEVIGGGQRYESFWEWFIEIAIPDTRDAMDEQAIEELATGSDCKEA